MKRKLNTETIKTYIVILLACSCICLFILGLILGRRTESYNYWIEGLQKTTYSTTEFGGEVMAKKFESENYSLIMTSGDDVCVTRDQYEQISIGDIITYYRTTYTYQKPIGVFFAVIPETQEGAITYMDKKTCEDEAQAHINDEIAKAKRNLNKFPIWTLVVISLAVGFLVVIIYIIRNPFDDDLSLFQYEKRDEDDKRCKNRITKTSEM